MGRLKGPIRLQGTHSDFTFAETTDGFVWKKKLKARDKQKYATHPDYEKIRDNMAKFSRAGKAVKLFREAFAEQVSIAKDPRLTPRLQTVMMQVVKGDAVSGRGLKTPQKGALDLLEHFEVNGRAKLFNSIEVELSATYDRVTGKASLDVPEFVPKQALRYAPNATHFDIICAAAEFDFDLEHKRKELEVTPMFPIDGATVAPFTLTTALTPASDMPVIILAGIRFYEVTNGFTYPERNGEFNALCVMKTDKP